MSKTNGNGKPAKPPVAAATTKTPDGKLIRAGNRNPYRKATNEEIEQRVAELVEVYRKNPLIGRHEIYKKVCNKWGVKWNVVDKIYILRARKVLLQQARQSQEEVKTSVVQTLFDILKANGNKNQDRLKAADQLAKIYGLNSPDKTELTGLNGGPIELKDRPLRDVPEERLLELTRILKPPGIEN